MDPDRATKPIRQLVRSRLGVSRSSTFEGEILPPCYFEEIPAVLEFWKANGWALIARFDTGSPGIGSRRWSPNVCFVPP